MGYPTQQQKVDYLFKKIGFTKTKTGVAEDQTSGFSGDTKKAPPNEAIASPLIIPSSTIWSDSGFITATPPTSNTAYVGVYTTATAYRMTVDTTVANERTFIARQTWGNPSSAIEGDWIDTQFGADYLIKVYKNDPSVGVAGVDYFNLSAAGTTGKDDVWFFDYSSGVLNFNGEDLDGQLTGITTSNIYIVGYRYIGRKGVQPAAGIGTFHDLVVSNNLSVGGISTFGGLIDANGIIEGIAGQNKIPSLYANYSDLPNAGTYHGMFAHVHATQKGYFAHAGGWYELVNKETTGVVGTGTEKYNLGFTDTVNLKATGITTLGSIGISTGLITGPAVTYIDPAAVGDDTGLLVVKGNLQVDGTQTTVNSATMTVTDKNILLAKGAANDAAADGGGITVASGGGDKTWSWLDGNDSWSSSEHIRVADEKVYGWVDDTNTYIGRPAADTIAFTHGGSEKVRISSAGNVGIGSTIPEKKLDVNGDTKIEGVLSVVGIGTSVPKASIRNSGIQTSQTGVALALLHNSNTFMRGNHLIVDDFPSGSGTYFIQATEHALTNDRNLVLQGYGGKVGIGSAIPSTTLDVYGTSKFQDDVDFVGTPVGTAQTSIKFHKGDGSNSDLDSLRFYDSSSISVGAGVTGGFVMRGNYNGAGPTYNSFILTRGNNFFIDGGTGTSIKIRTRFARNAIVANPDDGGGSGTVELYHSSSGTATRRLETSGIGITVTGSNINIEGGSAALSQLKINSTGRYRGIQLDENGTRKAHFQHDATDNKTIVGTAEGTMQFNSGDTPRVILNSSGHWVPYADSTYDLGISATRWRNVYADAADLRETLNVAGISTLSKEVGIGSALNVVGVSTFNDDVTITSGDLLIDSNSAEINLKAGTSGQTGAVNWTFNSTGTNYSSISLPFDTRITDGFIIDGDNYNVSVKTDGFVKLYSGGNVKLNTNSNGIDVTGLTETDTLTTGNATFTGTISAGSTTGTDGYYLKTTGIGVTWAAFPSSRTGLTTSATAGQTTFNFSYNVGYVDVFLNGVKLPESEFVASNGSTIVLDDAAFANDTLEFVSYNTVPNSSAGAQNLTGLADVTITGTPVIGETLQHNGSVFVNDYTVSTTTTSTSQATISSLPIATYRSVEYTIQVTEGTKYHVTKVLAIHDGTNVSFNEYGTLTTSTSLSTFALDINSGNMRLLATPASTNSTVFKVKFTGIKV